MKRTTIRTVLIFAVTMHFAFSWGTPASGQPGTTTINPKTLVGEGGLGDLKMVFEPGMRIGEERVKKTFQPSFTVTSKGTLLVFCQGRLKAGDDDSPKVILMNRSSDYGQSWEGTEVLSGPMNHFAISSYTAMIDGKERISFLTCVALKVTRKYYGDDAEKMRTRTGIDINEVGRDKAAALCRYYSDDDGNTWTREVLTGDKSPLYKNIDGFTPVFFNAIGQVHTLSEGPRKGRMIIAGPVYAADGIEPTSDNFRDYPCTGSGILFSDDLGETWQMNGWITDYQANEASAVSIDDGRALLMIRRQNDPARYKDHSQIFTIRTGDEKRMAHTSEDGGATWSAPFLIDVSEVRCHGTLARVNNRLYFSIPVGLEDRDQEKKRWDDDRIRGAVYFSDDEGGTWNRAIVEPAYFSYSTIGKLMDNYLITFFSRGGHGRFGIGYRIFTDQWLDDH